MPCGTSGSDASGLSTSSTPLAWGGTGTPKTGSRTAAECVNHESTAVEVIVEAPCCTASGGILPLANFGTVSITGSLANGSALGNAGGVTQIVMINRAGRDKDSVSSLSGAENFSATWLRSS